MIENILNIISNFKAVLEAPDQYEAREGTEKFGRTVECIPHCFHLINTSLTNYFLPYLKH